MGLFGKKHSVGKTIAELRKEKGWTQIELAEKLQVSDKAVRKWEKDSGAPSVEFFPALAEVFGVSIDYLMTGKKVEPEIIAMSKTELCAKNDDVSLFETLSYEVLKNSDENGKTILDYFLKYDTKKVVKAFFKKYPVKTIQQTNCYRAGNSLWYTDKVIKLLIINNMVNELQSINAFVRNSSRQYNEWNIYTKEYQKLILTNANVGDDLKECYFKNLTAEEINQALCLALDEQREKDVLLLWKVIENINAKNIEEKEQKTNEVAGRYMTSVSYSQAPCREYEAIGTGCYYKYYVISLSVETLQKLLNNGYVDIVRQANDFNRKIGSSTINEEAIQAAILKQNGGNEDEIKVLSVLQNGIVNIDKLLETKDFKFIKKTLFEYPIHIVELLDEWFRNSKWKELYRFAIDNNDESLANVIVEKDDKEYIISKIQKYFIKDKNNINKKHFFVYENARQKSFASPNKEQFEKIKQRIIDELSLKIDKTTTIGNLTKEYFENELAKGNIDMVVIKLCVRLEAILKCDYHYDGELSAMLEKYCQEHCSEDDGWGYLVESECVKYLQKLRMKRNNIVHSEKNGVNLTLEELKYCIDYICKMG